MITRLWNSYPGCQHCYCLAQLPSGSSSHSPQTLPAKMVCRHISSDLKEMALSMALQGLRDLDVHEFTGICVHLLMWLCSTFRRTGDVLPPPLIDPGWPRILMAIQVKVSSVQHIIPILHLTPWTSFSVIVFLTSQTWHLWNFELNFVKGAMWRCLWLQSHVHSKGKGILWKWYIVFDYWLCLCSHLPRSHIPL